MIIDDTKEGEKVIKLRYSHRQRLSETKRKEHQKKIEKRKTQLTIAEEEIKLSKFQSTTCIINKNFLTTNDLIFL